MSHNHNPEEICCRQFKEHFNMLDVECCQACLHDTDHDFNRNTDDVFAGGAYWSVCCGLAQDFYQRYPNGI